MYTEQLNAEWNRVVDKIHEDDSIDSSQVSAFFPRLQPQAMSNGYLMLTADNDFIKSWIEKHYVGAIKKALADIHGREYTVEIEVNENQHYTVEPEHAETDKIPVSPEVVQVKNLPEEDFQETKKDETRPQFEPEYQLTRSSEDYPLSPTSSLTFSNFVIGDSNRMAYSMAVAVAEEPGRQMLNPLFIYGKSGLGKTHLMRAIQNYIGETQPNLRTVYVDSADFLSGYVEATLAHDKEKTSYKTFKNHYQDANVLLIDDIQYLQGKEQTLDIVFQIFNHMVDEGKQVVLSADRAPKNITMDERYRSRFNSGGTFDIQPPGVETKLGIIKSFINEYRVSSNQPNFYFPDEVSRYIAENSGSNIRELKSAITIIIYSINAYGVDDLTDEKLSRLLENHFSGGTMKKLKIVDIQKEVEQYYGVTHADLIGPKRDRKNAYARKIAAYISREMLDLPYDSIAKEFGGRDHTTIMHSVNSVEKQMSESREVREEIENIKRRIKER